MNANNLVIRDQSREVMLITADGELILNIENAPAAAQALMDEFHRLSGFVNPRPIDTAPRDGTLFDIERGGVPYLDCYFDERGLLVQEHDYPSMTRLFNMTVDIPMTWTPRPASRLKPYEANKYGVRYVP